MSFLDCLSYKNKEWFSRLEPAEFRVGGIDCVAYLARVESLDSGLAIVDVCGMGVFYGWLENCSLKGYDGLVEAGLVEDLSRLVCDEECEIGNVEGLDKMIDFRVCSAFCSD